MSKWVKLPDGTDPETAGEESRLMQIAALIVAGTSQKQIAIQLGMDQKEVKRYSNKEECKALIRNLGEEAFNAAAAQLKLGMRERLAKAMKVIDTHLEDNNLNAAIQVIKSIDKEQHQDATTGDTVIQIAMPSLPQEPKNVTIDAESTEVKE